MAPGRLRAESDFLEAATGLFGALLDCPPARTDEPVSYPGHREEQRSRHRRAHGVPLTATLHRELREVADRLAVPFPAPVPDPAGPADPKGGPA